VYFKRVLYTIGEVAKGFGVNEEQVNDWVNRGWLKVHPSSHPSWKRVHYSDLTEFANAKRLTLSKVRLEGAEPKVLCVGKIAFIPHCEVHTAQRLTDVASALCHHVFDVVVFDHLTADPVHISLIARELVTDPFHGQPRLIHIVEKHSRKSSPRHGQNVTMTAPLDIQELSKLCNEEYRRESV